MNNSGNIFSSNYSTSNPFNMNGMGNVSSSLDNSLMESYAKLEALKQKQAELASLSQQKPDAQVRRTLKPKHGMPNETVYVFRLDEGLLETIEDWMAEAENCPEI